MEHVFYFLNKKGPFQVLELGRRYILGFNYEINFYFDPMAILNARFGNPKNIKNTYSGCNLT